MGKIRVFYSFDFDNDKGLKEMLIGQSKLPDSPFEVADHSLKEAAPEANWEAKSESAIKRSEVVIVVLGALTHSASGVKKEVRMARNNDKRMFQLQPQNESRKPVTGAGRVYNWTWENLKNLLN